MRPLRQMLAVLAFLPLFSASPGLAKVVTIEATAPLEDQSAQSVKAAIVAVVQSAAQGALAMGLSWVKVSQVLVLEDHVRVRVLATDVKPEGEEGANNEEESDDADVGPSPGGGKIPAHLSPPGRAGAWLR
jgi:hypothetical protein